jgi:hypothetical protein
MTPHASRAVSFIRTPLVTGTLIGVLLAGCGSGGGGGGNNDVAGPTPDAAVKMDVAVPATGGTQGNPDLPSATGGAGGSADVGAATGGAGGSAVVDASPDAVLSGPEVGRDAPASEAFPVDRNLPDAPDVALGLETGGVDVNRGEAGPTPDGGGPGSCQNPTLAKSSSVPGLLSAVWDKNDKLVTGGYFASGSTDFLGQAVTNQGSADMFLAGIDPSTGNASWILTAGDNLDQFVTQVATSSSGMVGAIGNFTGSVEIVTGSPMTNAASKAIDFIVGVDSATGTGTWSNQVNLGLPATGSTAYGRLNAIAGSIGKNYFVVCGTATNNAPSLVTGATNGGGKDIVVAALNAATGTVLWSKLFGGAMDQSCTAAALDDAGNVLLAGQYAGALDFGNGALIPAPTGTTDHILWVAKLDGTTGATMGAMGFGTTGLIMPNSIAADAQGNILVGGQFGVAVTFGTAQLTPVGTNDAFVAKLNSSLVPVWARRWGGTGAGAACTGVSASSNGNLVAVGAFRGTADVGPGSTVLTANAPTGLDVFIVGLDGTSGATTCAHHYGDSAPTASQGARWVSVNRMSTGIFKDSVATVGNFVSTIDFGQAGSTLLGGGPSNPYAFLLLTTP